MSESGEKQFAPTEKRKKDAALKGDVLRSKDLATAASVLVGFGLLAVAGPWLGGELMELVRASLSFDHGAVVRRHPDDFDPVFRRDFFDPHRGHYRHGDFVDLVC